ncbi:hypothetical protein B0H63DRAFT_557426 [Podospora didyma]|uniref:Signal recognition particle subunit SRP68 n=1 Tax=Podospora didyma TaxID=330526 RepID=A0AAE0NZF6_9PEZI|nr:hypothetical protein B0H63DRAFT_557426 [Podospora didyma]
MDITKFIVSSREMALLYGDYATYRSQLAGKLLNCRKKLNIVTKSRGKFNPKIQVTAAQIAENHEYLHLQLLTSERAWAHAMAMKSAHSTDTKGMSSKTRSHIVSRLEKAARGAENLAGVLSEAAVSGAVSTDILEARAYASLLRGAAQFEKQSWETCLKSYAISRIVYSALSTSAKGDVFKDLLSETIDPSIRYAAYQAKIPRTQPIATIAQQAFAHADANLVGRIQSLNPSVLEQGDPDAKQGSSGAEGAPTTITWRAREVKIEDAAIAVAWASVGTAKSRLAAKVSSTSSLQPKDMAAAYDDILIASQDAVDATKQAIDELKNEGVTQSDPRMQSLQITRTAVNYEMISWRIGRNRALVGENDGAKLDFGQAPRGKVATTEGAERSKKDEAPNKQITKLKEKVVLYDGALQSLESITELPGVANDQELSSRLKATSEYFTALKCLAIARSHAIAGNAANALALVDHALDQCREAGPVLSRADGNDSPASAPRNINVSKRDVRSLHDLLSGELQRARALVEILNLKKQNPSKTDLSQNKPLINQLSTYPAGGVDLQNIVVYPPHVESVPVKPLFLDVAWNYIDYPDNQPRQLLSTNDRIEKGPEKAATEESAKPQKRGWFGFGR